MAPDRPMRDAVTWEIVWMASAMIHARPDPAQFRALLGLVKSWPTFKILAFAERLAPGDGRGGALNAIETFHADAGLEETIRRASRELIVSLHPAKTE